MSYTIQQISSIVNGTALLAEPLIIVEHLLTDSRRLISPSTSLFFALTTKRKDGSFFIKELYRKGVKNFIVKKGFKTSSYTGANFISVDDPLRSLQKLAAYHRNQFNIPVIGITGSNGKTIVKEWLNGLLQEDYKIIRSPKSYNSQVGVPLSVWQITQEHNLAIFEAGISQPAEMEYLQEIIKPTIGVFTTIGEAHNEGFLNAQQKALEKAILFHSSKIIIYNKDALAPVLLAGQNEKNFFGTDAELFSWSRRSPADLLVLQEENIGSSTIIKAAVQPGNDEVTIEIPFIDQISVDNALTCLSVMFALGYKKEIFVERFKMLAPVEMRMQLKKGINNCIIINDSYSNDLSSLVLALNYLKSQQGIKMTTAIISDLAESGLDAIAQFNAVIAHLNDRNISKAILVGPVFYESKNPGFTEDSYTSTGKCSIKFYASTKDFLQQCNTNEFRDEVILLKGARTFEFENISRWLEEKTHQTVMEVNLNAMVHNLKQHQRYLQPATKVMAMVKAFSYGSGTSEVANLLQFHKVDYLAVAYADEGIDLRKAGISMPIMVMNPETSTFSSLIEYNLEPEIYSFNILKTFIAHLQQQAVNRFPVHLKIDTGMHRLGFDINEIDELLSIFKRENILVVKSVFSHLVASEDAYLDHFTGEQSKRFDEVCLKVQNLVAYPFIRHLSNSAAIFRHPHLQYDMVRLGIGLYGIAPAGHKLDLQNVAALKTTIAQIRVVQAGESVGYSRKGIVQEDSLIATVRIGYADGYSRKFSNGKGNMLVKGSLAPVVGNVCMDMTMLNITHIQDVQEGDEVEIFGTNLPVEQVAKWADTIVYEILTGISQRIKRVYYEE